jgi:hypothetical protein
VKTPRHLRRILKQTAAKRTSRRRLVIVFVSLVGLLVVGFIFWYLPHQPTSVVERAIVKSLKYQSVSFTITSDGRSVNTSKGRIDKQGDSLIELYKDGRRITIITAGGGAYINGGDDQWLEVSLESTGAMLPGQPAGLQSASLKAADRKRIERLYDKHSFISVSKVFDEELVAGRMSYHYQVKADKKRLRAFLEAAQRDIPELKLRAGGIATILDASLLDRSLDIWIDKSDGVIRQVAYAEVAGSTVQIGFDGYGKDIDIAKPQSAVPLLETLRR